MAQSIQELGAHKSFPLTSLVLSSCSLTPEFAYFERDNARRLQGLLQASLPHYTAGEIAAAGLLGRIYLTVVRKSLEANPDMFPDLDQVLSSAADRKTANRALVSTLESFPTSSSYYNPAVLSAYTLSPDGDPWLRYNLYGSLLLILTAEKNPFFLKRDGVFSDPQLRSEPSFKQLRDAFYIYFDSQPAVGGTSLSLLDFLQEPGRAHPDSLFEQLAYIRKNWHGLLDPALIQELLSGLDLLKEERQRGSFAPGSPGDPLGHMLASYQSADDLVRFSADQDWMPRVILLAKNAYVWLDQLSKAYQRPIYRLDQIPEAEFKKLAEWGVTGLWLIGIWERSPASQQIKQLTGNPDAVPSAYSLYDYSIAAALGGEEGYQSMLALASNYGIRLAADMVPNHMGIFSRWVLEHPDWFLSLDQPPYPGYTFNGPDLSSSPSVSIFLEDHYYDQSDAAVVFKRTDRGARSSRYIYHGNDGTSMPWNDTAQLDFLNPAVREAVIQTILHVARKFPIIRFDAAMTLTKKHYQRLWFPEPGSGGAIPTRSDHGLTRKEFDQRMPDEFWREVVDRVAEEVPDTLLLAEAFWMMEGFFVRSLGMHRVYNSAFMHMIRDEDNDKYRDLILMTLEYDPQILKRYVNFMNNPDEETAVAQFGSDGKYFGTCLLMTTLPGLPMFGHGQIEGFSEKYGMEYKRAYYDETPDLELIKRHQREIFPLLHKRYLFAEVEHFVLYDLQDPSGNICQDVFAYSNRAGAERALILYHNKWGEISGRIQSSPLIDGKRTSLLSGLGYTGNEGDFLLFREHITGLEYIRSLPDLAAHGLAVSLGAYTYQVFLDFKVVRDHDGSFRDLHDILAGSGTDSIERARKRIVLSPIEDFICDLYQLFQDPSKASEIKCSFSAATDLISSFEQALKDVDKKLDQDLPGQSPSLILSRLQRLERNSKLITKDLSVFSPFYAALGCFLADLHQLHLFLLDLGFPHSIARKIKLAAPDSSESEEEIVRRIEAVALLLGGIENYALAPDSLFDLCLEYPALRKFLGVNEHAGVFWFNQERMEDLHLTSFSLLLALFPAESDQAVGPPAYQDLIVRTADFSRRLKEAISGSDFQLASLLSLLHPGSRS